HHRRVTACMTTIQTINSIGCRYVSCNGTSPTAIYTLSLHDALPIWTPAAGTSRATTEDGTLRNVTPSTTPPVQRTFAVTVDVPRSEEHTSELQSQSNLVCRLLLEKKKKNPKKTQTEPNRQKKYARPK